MTKKQKVRKTPEKNTEKHIVVRNMPRPTEFTTLRPVDMRAEMNKWFEDLQSAMEQRFFNPWIPASAFIDVKEPSMDIIDKGNEFEVHADMPGIPKENIEINVTPTHIEISGEYEKKEEDSRKEFVRQERVYSQFYRTSALPEDIVPDKAEASVNNGVLVVKLPKKEPTLEKRKHKVVIK